jgi:hypothetical protein
LNASVPLGGNEEARMDYNFARSQAVRDSYAKNVQDFLDHYRAGAPTVVMLPGGMGSQLDRSPEAYHGSAMSFLDYTPVWLSPGVLFRGDALTLEMDGAGHDIRDFIIVPDGPLRFLVKAYDGTEKFFIDKGANYIVFGFDWRRPLEEGAVNLQSFLTSLRQAVFAQHHDNIVPKTILLCHSQGGLVAKMFLDIVQNNAGAWLDKVITVATPFYGTATHMQRYFVGEHMLNILHGATRVARIVGTLPGPYTLLPIDRATWTKRQAALGLTGQPYPVQDSSGVPVDPYDTGNLGAGRRYPAWVAAASLDAARDIRGSIDIDLPAESLGRIFNLRATTTDTPCYFRWDALPANFDPDRGPCPLQPLPQDATQRRGDGTVPYWSARLAQVGDDRVYDVPTTAAHQDLLENRRTLEAVWTIIQNGTIAGFSPTEPDSSYSVEAPAAPAEVDQFLSDAAAKRVAPTDPRAHDPRLWRGVVRGMLR